MTLHSVSEDERIVINKILNDFKSENKEFGNYVHHYYLNSYFIVIKLTNGYFKISKKLLENYLREMNSAANYPLLKKAIASFVKVTLI